MDRDHAASGKVARPMTRAANPGQRITYRRECDPPSIGILVARRPIDSQALRRRLSRSLSDPESARASP